MTDGFNQHHQFTAEAQQTGFEPEKKDGHIVIDLDCADVLSCFSTDTLHREVASREALGDDGDQVRDPKTAAAQVLHIRRLCAQAVQDIMDIQKNMRAQVAEGAIRKPGRIENWEGELEDVASLFEHVLDPIPGDSAITRYERESLQREITELKTKLALFEKQGEMFNEPKDV